MKYVFCGLILVSAAPAMAEEGEGQWTKEIQLNLTPKIGTSLPLSTDLDPVDNSGVDGSFTIERKGRTGLSDFAITFGITSAPQLLDDNNETSSLYVKATVGDRFIPFGEILRRVDGRDLSIEPDAWRPYASYQFARVHSGLLDRRTSDDHTMTIGIRYRDIRSVMRSSGERGVYAEFRGEIQRVWSTLDEREEIVPSVRARLYSRPLPGGWRIFGEGRGDYKFFTNRPLVGGEDREDRRLRLTLGADLSSLLNGPQVEVGVEYQKLWSNDDTADHDRLFFAPTISLGHKF